MTDDFVSYVLAAFRGHGRSRSPLYWWMAEHHAELAKAKEAGRRVDWISVTAEMARLGMKAADKKTPLKPETVRRTWHRVDADVKAGVIVPGLIAKPNPEPARSASPPADPPSRPQLPPEPVVQPVSPDDDGYKEIQALGADGKLTTVRVRKR